MCVVNFFFPHSFRLFIGPQQTAIPDVQHGRRWRESCSWAHPNGLQMGVCRSSRSSHRSLCVYIAAICFLLSERRTDSRNPVPLVDGECCHVPCYPRESHLASLSDCCSFFFPRRVKSASLPGCTTAGTVSSAQAQKTIDVSLGGARSRVAIDKGV